MRANYALFYIIGTILFSINVISLIKKDKIDTKCDTSTYLFISNFRKCNKIINKRSKFFMQVTDFCLREHLVLRSRLPALYMYFSEK